MMESYYSYYSLYSHLSDVDAVYGNLPCFKRKNNPPITKGPAIAANPIKPKTFKTSEVSMAGSVANNNEVNEEFILA